MTINGILYKVLSKEPRTCSNGKPNPYTLKVQMVNKPFLISYYKELQPKGNK